MARPATPDIRITEGLSPAAAPVDTYVRPVAPVESDLTGVAHALAGLDQNLAGWAAKLEEKRKEEDLLRGEAAFHKNNQKGYAEGVRQDLIPADKSPEFVNGYKRAQGSTAGFQMESNLSAAFDKWDGKTDGNPAAFDKWFRENTINLITTDDPAILKGLLPHMREMQNKFHDRWQAEVTKNTQYTGQASFSALMASTIDAYQRDGFTRKTGTDYATLGNTLEAIREKGFEIGLKKTKIDELLIDAITTRAEVHRDGDILGLLDRNGSTGVPLANTPYGQAKKLATTNTLMSLWKTQTAEERTRLDREDRLNSQQAKGRITEALLKNPDAELDETDIRTVQKLDGNFKLDIIEWRKKVREGDVAEDPKMVAQVHTDILAGGGIDTLWKAIWSGDIKSPETIDKTMTFLKATEEYSKAPAKILGTLAAKSYITQIETIGQDQKYAKNRIFGDSAMTEGGRNALNSFRSGLMQWQSRNPDATVLEQERHATELGEQILKGMGTGQKQGRYTEDPAVTATRPQGPFTPPSAATPSVPASPPAQAAPPTVTQPTPQATPPAWMERFNNAKDAPPSVNDLGMTPAEREQLNSVATKRGVSPQDLINEKWRTMNPTTLQPGKRSSLELPGGLGTIELANLSEDQAQVIRDTISKLTFPVTGTRGQFSQEGPEQVNPQRAAHVRNSLVGPVVDAIADAHGFDKDKLAAIVSVESGGDPNARAGDHHGLLQLSPSEFAEYGRKGGDILNGRDNLEAGVRSLMDKGRRFAAEFGREPSAVELYLMHQQGEAGLRAHEKNLDASAWQNMHSTGEGKRKGVAWSKLAVWGNVPSDLRQQFVTVDRMTSRQFIAAWTSKLKGIPYAQALAEVSKDAQTQA